MPKVKIRHICPGETFRYKGTIYMKWPGEDTARNAVDIENQNVVFLPEDEVEMEFVKVKVQVIQEG